MSGFVKSWIKDNRPETDELFHFDIPLPNVRGKIPVFLLVSPQIYIYLYATEH